MKNNAWVQFSSLRENLTILVIFPRSLSGNINAFLSSKDSTVSSRNVYTYFNTQHRTYWIFLINLSFTFFGRQQNLSEKTFKFKWNGEQNVFFIANQFGTCALFLTRNDCDFLISFSTNYRSYYSHAQRIYPSHGNYLRTYYFKSLQNL